MIIKTYNTLSEGAPKTFTTFPEVAGTNVIRWQNPNAFGSSWAIQLGETGEEQSEVVILSSTTPSGTAGTLTANTLYEHPTNTPIYGIKYDQVVFEVSTNGTSGTASPIANGTITYQPDKEFTQFDYTSGTTTDAYKSYFRASVLSQNTTESDWITSGGFSFYSLASIRKRIKEKLWNADWLTDQMIDNWINEWKFQMENEVIQVNEDYSMGTVNVGFGTDGLGTITTADFSQPRRVWLTYDGINKFQSTKMHVNSWFPEQVFSSTHPYHAWVGDSVFQVKPEQNGGTAEIIFYRFGTVMVNDTDELPVPMRSYTKSFTDYSLAQALFKDQKPDWKQKIVEANAEKMNFVGNIVPRDKTGPTQIDIVEPISGDYY